jgi:hypothetical protein
VATAPDTGVDFRELRKKSRLLEKEFGVRVQVGRARRPHPALGERLSRAGGSLGGIRRSPASLPRRSAA